MKILIVPAALCIGALLAFWSLAAIAFWPITLLILAMLVAKAGAHELAWLILTGAFAAMIIRPWKAERAEQHAALAREARHAAGLAAQPWNRHC